MKSVVLRLKSPEEAQQLVQKLKAAGSSLELSPMSSGDVIARRKVGKSIFDEMDQLLIIGEEAEIEKQLTAHLGDKWEGLTGVYQPQDNAQVEISDADPSNPDTGPK